MGENIFKLIEDEFENEYLDFKAKQYEKANKEEMIKDIMAMANSDYSGDKYIIIGIKCYPSGEKDIIGVPTDEIKDSAEIQNTVLDNIESDLKIEYFPIDYEDKKLCILKILASNKNTPYMLKKDCDNIKKGSCYVRKGSINSVANRNDWFRMTKKVEEVSLEICQSYLAAVYEDEGVADIEVVFSNNTSKSVIFRKGTLKVYDESFNLLSIHPVMGLQNLGSVDLNIKILPKDEISGCLKVAFCSTDCLRLGLDEYGMCEGEYIFELQMWDAHGNEYICRRDEGFIYAKGKFLWKVNLNKKK